MSVFKKRPSVSEDAAGGGDSSMFSVTLGQLKDLMNKYGKEFVEKLNSSDYNGVQGILEKLKVDRNTGLHSNNQQDLEQRRTAYGKNIISQKPQSFLSVLTSPSKWSLKRDSRRELDQFDEHQVSVVRDSRIQEIPAKELVVGDLCVIKSGDYLPADGLVIEGNDLKVDESSLTGETGLVEKGENGDAHLLSGAQVMEGTGRMVVVAVGPHSVVAVICDLLRN